MKYLVSVFLLSVTLIPAVAGAQGLVTCEGVDCNFCTFAEMVNNIVQWLVAILTLVAVMLMVYAGFKLVTSAGDTSAVQEAKKLLTNVIIGFVIILAAWTLVDTLIKALASDEVEVGVWRPIHCGTIYQPPDRLSPMGTNSIGPDGLPQIDATETTVGRGQQQ